MSKTIRVDHIAPRWSDERERWGAGSHNPAPRRLRTRTDIERAALAEELQDSHVPIEDDEDEEAWYKEYLETYGQPDIPETP